MINLNFESFVKALNRDPEWVRTIRFFDGDILLAFGADAFKMQFEDGKMISLCKADQDDTALISVKAPEDTWNEMLKPVPRPFYQCLETTDVKHDLVMSRNTVSYAYLPAMNRLLQFMRETINEGA